MSLKKQYVKNKKICKVTFKVPEKAVKGARKINVVGDFNEWDVRANPMKRLKKGGFTLTMELDKDHEFQFKYIIDGKQWENDWEADKYIPSSLGTWDNSVVVT